jgi:hypothetical protein
MLCLDALCHTCAALLSALFAVEHPLPDERVDVRFILHRFSSLVEPADASAQQAYIAGSQSCQTTELFKGSIILADVTGMGIEHPMKSLQDCFVLL